jgi:glutathione S-transferase
MPSYKLIYFNGRGLGEVCRLLFALGDQQYEDVRIARDEWDQKKASVAPIFGQLPMLEVDGVRLCQSNTCARYLANQFHLAGKTDLEKAQADMVVDCLADAFKPAISVFYEKDEARKVEMKKKYIDEQLPQFFTYFEAMLTSNHGGDNYFVGSELTWADVAFYNFIFWAGNFTGSDKVIEKFPKLTALYKKVDSNPKIAEWVAKRPKTEF